MGDVWKVVVPVVGSLIAGVLLHVLKEGGVRRLRRRNIKEELELLEVLGEHPEPAARIRKRVKVMLEQYEPSEGKVATRRRRLITLVEVLAAFLASLVVIVVFELESPWAYAGAGLLFSVVINVAEWLVERGRDRDEQDEAVYGTVEGVFATVTMTAEGVVSPPKHDSDSGP